MVATGCSKGSQTSTSSGESSTAASPAAASPAAAESSPAAAEASPAAVAAGGGDVAHGKTLFAANCASCHGADGSGGVGPNLHGDLKNPAMAKTQDAVVAWIKDPKP
ncbi:MAG: c-type cytochrome, partial [bacterium]|nr:c-type cytochrome [bacterium]